MTADAESNELVLFPPADLSIGKAGPLRSCLSFDPLARYVETLQARCDNPFLRPHLDALVEGLRARPELRAPLTDPAAFERNTPFLRALLTLVVTENMAENDSVAAIIPFQPSGFLASRRFERVFLDDRHTLRARPRINKNSGAMVRTATSFIFEKVFGLARADFSWTESLFDVPDPATGLGMVYSFRLSPKFVDVVPCAGFALPDADTVKAAYARFLAGEDVSDAIPVQQFEFQGFSFVHAHDVTTRETLAEFKETLVVKESVTSRVRFLDLQSAFRKLLREPKLDMSLVYAYEGRFFRICAKADPSGATIREEEVEVPTDGGAFKGTSYCEAWDSKCPVAIPDLRLKGGLQSVEQDFLAHGLVGLYVCPLIYQDECIGFLELSSTAPIDASRWDRDALAEVQALLAVAVHRAMAETDAQLDKIIKLHCTSIHPCVEWRFRRVAHDFHSQLRRGEGVEMPVIEFRHVFPLFGTSDIRGSSLLRKQAIADDLGAQMGLAQEILRGALAIAEAPWIAKIAREIDAHLLHLGRDLSAGQEISMLDFLRREVEPALRATTLFAPALAPRVEAYFAQVENEHKSLYVARDRYERSVRALNVALTADLDERNARAQAVFPHIFERHATDGVEHSVYMGDEMSEHRGFSPFHLRNIRLWQLIAMAGNAGVAHRLRPTLELDLELAHLLVVQNIPITLKFFFDEKRFDVDGAYNTRYEIIKKRLDKSHVKGTGERLTQCGRIAIVYSQETERAEYIDYLAVLAGEGIIERHWEELEVDDLEGVTGLRALRVTLDAAFLAGRGSGAEAVGAGIVFPPLARTG